MKDATKIYYLCDGEVPTCKKACCYKDGGICDKTTDIAHAINFEPRGKVGNYQEKTAHDKRVQK